MPESDVTISDVVIVDAMESLRNNSNYKIVDYLQFTGTQYIDTGIIPSNHMTEIKVNFDSYNNDEHLLGTSSGTAYYHFTTYSNKYYWGKKWR